MKPKKAIPPQFLKGKKPVSKSQARRVAMMMGKKVDAEDMKDGGVDEATEKS